jgi:hypothetical protein
MSFLDALLKPIQGALAGQPSVTPAPQGAATPPQEMGGNVVDQASDDSINEDTELQGELLTLMRKATETSDVSERLQIQRTRRAREYFNGKMGGYFDENSNSFLPITNSALSAYGVADDDDDSEPVLNWNLYQATGLYIIAVLSGGPPTVRFFPANADNQLDVATAKASNVITELFYRTNDIDALIAREAFYLYNDGVFFAYVRHKVDAQRFGTHQEDVIEPRPVQLSQDAYGCDTCGAQTPAAHVAQQLANPAPPAPPMAGMPGGLPGALLPQAPQAGCGSCGNPIDPASFVPGQSTMVPQKTGEKTVPNGGELLDIFGRLEVRVPPFAKDLASAQWLQLRTDIDVSELRFEFPNLSERITANSPGDGVSAEARLARISTQGGGWQSPSGYAQDDGEQTATYTRTWLRPSIFYRITDLDRRTSLLQKFPDGCYVAFAGNTFLQARNESLDKYWVACHAYPGDGMVRPSIGDVLLDPQDALNDLMDSELQNARMSVPQVFVDSKTVDRRAWMQARQRGGNTFPVTRQGNEAVGDSFFQTAPAGENAGAVNLRQEIFGPIAQYLSATLPGMTGQSDPNLKTARAYAQAKEQAMGRIGIVWRAIKQAHVEIVTKAVRLYIDFRTMDVSLPQITPQGFENADIRLDDLHGQVVAYPESDEAYPMSASDKRQVYEQLLQNPDPAIHGIATELDNLEYAKGVMGWGTLVMPGEKSRAKQMQEIQILLKSPPTQDPPPMGPVGPPPMGMGPMGPTPIGPPQMGPTGPPPPPHSTVPVQPVTDEHPVEFKVCQSWLHSQAGLQEAIDNPQGYQNVLLHAIEHHTAMQPPPPAPPPPDPIVVSDTAHLVAPNGQTLWSPPGEGPGAPGMAGALNQPSTKPIPAPTIHQPGSSPTIHMPGSGPQPGSVTAAPKEPKHSGGPSAPGGAPPPRPPSLGGPPPGPQPGLVPAPAGPPIAVPPPGGNPGPMHPVAGAKPVPKPLGVLK